MKRICLLLTISALSCVSAFADEFPYRLSPYTDAALLTAGAAGCSSYLWGRTAVDPYDEADLARMNKNSINPVDRTAAGRWSTLPADASNIAVGVFAAVPLSFAADERVRGRWFTLSVMYAESWLLCTGATETLKVSVRRTRPFVYGSSAPDNKKYSADARKSFPSGHTSSAFNAAVFTALVFSDLYPSSPLKPAVWAASFAAASGVGYLRFRAGRHFPSDIAAGALIGAGSAVSVILLHRQENGFVSLYSGGETGLSYTAEF